MPPGPPSSSRAVVAQQLPRVPLDGFPAHRGRPGRPAVPGPHGRAGPVVVRQRRLRTLRPARAGRHLLRRHERRRRRAGTARGGPRRLHHASRPRCSRAWWSRGCACRSARRVADLEASRAADFGVTRELETMVPYDRPAGLGAGVRRGRTSRACATRPASRPGRRSRWRCSGLPVTPAGRSTPHRSGGGRPGCAPGDAGTAPDGPHGGAAAAHPHPAVADAPTVAAGAAGARRRALLRQRPTPGSLSRSRATARSLVRVGRGRARGRRRAAACGDHHARPGPVEGPLDDLCGRRPVRRRPPIGTRCGSSRSPSPGTSLRPLAAVAPTTPARLTYRGGPLLTSVEVFVVYWGADWASQPLADTAAGSTSSSTRC